MRRLFFITVLTIIFLYTLLGFISYQINFPLIPQSYSFTGNKFYDYAGITHAQTNLSTGSGSIPELSQAAAQAGCQFLVITDLNLIEKPSEAEGYKNDVLVMLGGKFSFLGGHLLVYNFKGPWPFKGMGQSQIYFNDLLQNAKPSPSILVAAHPFLPRHSWENLSLPGLDGMEILNLDSIWHTALSDHKINVFGNLLMFPFNPDLSFLRIFSEPTQELTAWDENLKKRQFLGLAGSGATAKAVPFPDQVFKFPSYRQSFRLIKNHILLKSELTGSFEEDKTKLMGALGEGHFYFSVDLLGDPTGFYFTALEGNKEYLLGDTIRLEKRPIKLMADLGRDIDIPHEILLYKNGEVVSRSTGRSLTALINEKGAYRIVVKLQAPLPPPSGKTWFSWIFSNSIRVE